MSVWYKHIIIFILLVPSLMKGMGWVYNFLPNVQDTTVAYPIPICQQGAIGYVPRFQSEQISRLPNGFILVNRDYLEQRVKSDFVNALKVKTFTMTGFLFLGYFFDKIADDIKARNYGTWGDDVADTMKEAGMGLRCLGWSNVYSIAMNSSRANIPLNSLEDLYVLAGYVAARGLYLCFFSPESKKNGGANRV